MKKIRVSDSSIPFDIVFSMLKILPAISLMRFKCVCKSWRELITDPLFVEAHQTHSQTRPEATHLLIHCTNSMLNQYIFAANHHGKVSSEFPTLQFRVPGPCTDIVNGLICFYSYEHNRVAVLNLTTCETVTLPLIKSQSQNPNCYRPSYNLGFDPVTRKFKVLSFWTVRIGDSKKVESEILTLGTNSWRKIDGPVHKLRGKTVCVNGVVYWMNILPMNCKKAIQSFNVREEKFLMVFIPDGASEYRQLIQIEGKLALVCYESYYPIRVDLWILENGDQGWEKKSIDLPVDLWANGLRSVIGTTNAGEIILRDQENYSDALKLTCYDMRTGKFRTIEICSPVELGKSGEYLSITSHVENIWPLKTPENSKKKRKRGRAV
ncbi:unnamed protein product [Ilex paraguariensis]|uniref:F-box domain-containing protein n=1 Tax=Ilex paraguariensis TaxID=185542 RepID=A0ABC8RWD9_9AQUA